MALSIQTNLPSLNAARNLNQSKEMLNTSIQRLTTGFRINSAKDDAAGLAISDRMTSQVRGLNQAVRNANDGISMAQTAEGGLSETTNILQRMRELALQSANASNSAADRSSLQNEVSQLKLEMTRIATNTSFNGQKILDGSLQNASFQVGADARQTISVSIADSRSAGLGTNVVTTNNASNGIGRATYNTQVKTDGLGNVGEAQAVGPTSYAGGTNGYAAQTLSVRDAKGGVVEGGSVAVLAGDQASTIVDRLNKIDGVTATGSNQVKLTNYTPDATTAGTLTQFVISSGGTSQTLTLTGVDNTSSQDAVFTSLQNAINSSSSLTAAGVVAGKDDNGNLVIRNNTGADLGVQMNTTQAVAVDVTGTDSQNTAVTLTGDVAATSSTRVGGQINMQLAAGLTVESSLAGNAAGVDGLFKQSANGVATPVNSAVGISDVVSGQDTRNLIVSGGTTVGQAQTAAAAAPTNGYDVQTLKIKDASGTVINGGTIGVGINATAKTIVGALNAVSGVSAKGSNEATVSALKAVTALASATVTLDINGTQISTTGVAAAAGASMDGQFATLRDSINQNSTLSAAGITASLDKSGNLAIKNNTGDDLKIGLNVLDADTNVDSATAKVIGSDPAATPITLTAADTAGDAVDAAALSFTTVGGKFEVALQEGYTIESTEAKATGLFNAGADTAVTPKVTSNNFGNNVAAQTLTINGTGSADVAIARDDSAKVIAQKINAQAATTGVKAEGRTRAELSNLSAAGTVSFSLYGNNTAGVSISAAVTGSGNTADLTALANAINEKSDSTGIKATLSDSKAGITLEQSDGANIVLADFTHSAGSAPTAGNINGKTATMSVSGLTDSVNSSTGAITTQATTATTLSSGGITSGADSTVVGGTVSFRSPGAFAVKSDLDGAKTAVVGGDSSLFGSAASSNNASAKFSIDNVDISTVDGANNAIFALDAALSTVDTIRGTLGAVQNRFTSTISNLQNVAENLTGARSRIQDADFAAETASLSKNQVLQQAGIAMLSQANQQPQQLLSLLR